MTMHCIRRRGAAPVYNRVREREGKGPRPRPALFVVYVFSLNRSQELLCVPLKIACVQETLQCDGVVFCRGPRGMWHFNIINVAPVS